MTTTKNTTPAALEAIPLALDPDSPPLSAPSNPTVTLPNVGTPYQPVNQMSKGVRDILADLENQRVRPTPLAEQIITPEPAEEGKRSAQPFHRRDW